MSDRLQEILSNTRQMVEAAKREYPLAEVKELAKLHAGRGFRASLLAKAASDGLAVIAELKKASPSKGEIRGSFPVGRLAMQLSEGGAAALSVLTDEKYFKGSLQNLREASAAAGLPCLRKDFIVDEYQLWEAKANHADAVLLIAAALGDAEYSQLFHRAREIGLEVLCEVHDEQDLARTVAIGAEMIGVNTRNLKTMEVDAANHARLAGKLPGNAVRVAESGFRSGDDIREARAHGYQAFLIGETLMRADDPGAALRRLIGQAKAPKAEGMIGWGTGPRG